ncbi:MAG: aminotransferase class I/II-fold pyridoxal phosphate-dependent enzyme [Duncaniella sp.]|nr:aminotransferase class I/II-fold pyridoxal phosphate-dependent enzyme [Duncaniella sp.]
MPRIHLSMPHMSGHEMPFIQAAFAENWVVPLGPDVDAFEIDLQNYLSHDDPSREHIRVAALSAGTAAIHLGLILAGVKPGDEVICQDFTFAASANPITYLGAKPVFVDSEPHTWNMDPELLEQAISDRVAVTGRRPAAIVPVHLYGMPAMMDRIMEIATRWEIPVVEDAAEALGSTYRGHACGTFGHYGVLSFNGNKMITTSGGGALICPDDASRRQAIFYATQARDPLPYYHHTRIGYNYRLSNISAAIGRGQMMVLRDHIVHRQGLAALYGNLLTDIPGIAVHTAPSLEFEPNYWLTTITIDPEQTGGLTPEQVRQHLASLGIETRLLWRPMHMQPVFADAPAYTNGVSERLFATGLCLPSGPSVSHDDAREVIDSITSLIRR